MLTTPERRTSERARIPCHIPVELMDSARNAQFEADAVDLSVGGLSLRASRLPDLGSQLYCAFEAMPGGAQVLGRGEVVWRKEQGDEGGEFGLRFIEVDAKNQALIDEMVAERVARIEARFTQPEPVLAKLEIENVGSPVSARLLHAGEEQALFEQPLPQFSIGKAVVAHAGPTLVRGHISEVTVRMEGATPRIMLTLELARERSDFGEFMWNEPGSDTDPDVFAHPDRDSDVELPLARDSAPPAVVARPSSVGTLAGVGPQPLAATSVGTLAGPAVLPAPIYARGEPERGQMSLFRREQSHRATAPELGGLHLAADAESHERRSEVPDNVFVDEEQARELLSNDYAEPPEDAEEHTDPDADLEVWAAQPPAEQASSEPAEDAPPSPLAVKLLRVPAMLAASFRGVSEQVKDRASRLRDGSSQRIAGASRGNLFAAKPRRVTASSQREAADPRQNARVIAIGSLCIGSLALLAYVLTPANREDDGPHRAEQAAHEAANLTHGVPGAVDPAADPQHVAEATESSTHAATTEPAPEPSAKPATPAAPAKPAPAPKPAAQAAAAKPAAAPAAGKPPTPASNLQFGQKQVPNARRFVLKMSEPVKALTGSADAGGFSVVIANNRTLDRAAPLKALVPAIERAAIWNRKDNTVELSVRFVRGTSPAYRVSAGQDSTLEILIAQ